MANISNNSVRFPNIYTSTQQEALSDSDLSETDSSIGWQSLTHKKKTGRHRGIYQAETSRQVNYRAIGGWNITSHTRHTRAASTVKKQQEDPFFDRKKRQEPNVQMLYPDVCQFTSGRFHNQQLSVSSSLQNNNARQDPEKDPEKDDQGRQFACNEARASYSEVKDDDSSIRYALKMQDWFFAEKKVFLAADGKPRAPTQEEVFRQFSAKNHSLSTTLGECRFLQDLYWRQLPLYGKMINTNDINQKLKEIDTASAKRSLAIFIIKLANASLPINGKIPGHNTVLELFDPDLTGRISYCQLHLLVNRIDCHPSEKSAYTLYHIASTKLLETPQDSTNHQVLRIRLLFCALAHNFLPGEQKRLYTPDAIANYIDSLPCNTAILKVKFQFLVECHIRNWLINGHLVSAEKVKHSIAKYPKNIKSHLVFWFNQITKGHSAIEINSGISDASPSVPDQATESPGLNQPEAHENSTTEIGDSTQNSEDEKEYVNESEDSDSDDAFFTAEEDLEDNTPCNPSAHAGKKPDNNKVPPLHLTSQFSCSVTLFTRMIIKQLTKLINTINNDFSDQPHTCINVSNIPSFSDNHDRKGQTENTITFELTINNNDVLPSLLISLHNTFSRSERDHGLKTDYTSITIPDPKRDNWQTIYMVIHCGNFRPILKVQLHVQGYVTLETPEAREFADEAPPLLIQVTANQTRQKHEKAATRFPRPLQRILDPLTEQDSVRRHRAKDIQQTSQARHSDMEPRVAFFFALASRNISHPLPPDQERFTPLLPTVNLASAYPEPGRRAPDTIPGGPKVHGHQRFDEPDTQKEWGSGPWEYKAPRHGKSSVARHGRQEKEKQTDSKAINDKNIMTETVHWDEKIEKKSIYDIRDDLTRALVQAALNKSSPPLPDKYKVNKLFHDYVIKNLQGHCRQLQAEKRPVWTNFNLFTWLRQQFPTNTESPLLQGI